MASQQTQLDTIEANVTEAAQTSTKAVVELEKAGEAQRRSRRCKLWLACIAVVLVVIIVVAIVVPLTRH